MLQYSIESVKKFGKNPVCIQISGWLCDTRKGNTEITVRRKDGKELSFDMIRFARKDIAEIFRIRRDQSGFDLSFECTDPAQVEIVFASDAETAQFPAEAIQPCGTKLEVPIPFSVKWRTSRNACRTRILDTVSSGLCLLRQFKGYVFLKSPRIQRVYMRHVFPRLHPEITRNSTVCAKRFSQWGEHLLLVSHFADGSGAPMLALHIAEILEGFGFNLHIVLLRDGELHEKFCRYGKVYVVHSPADFQSVLAQCEPYKVRKAFLNTSASGIYAEILHDHGFTILTLVHEMAQTIYEMGLSDAAEKVLKFSSKIIIPSSLIGESWEKNGMPFPEDRTVTMPQSDYHSDLIPLKSQEERDQKSRSLRRSLGLPPDAFLVIGCGSLEPRKAPDVFFRTAQKIIAKNPNVYFLWIGDSGADFYRRKIDALIKPIESNARLLSYRNLNPYYYGADLFFLPSKYDPFPTVTLLAAKVGMPVIFCRASSGIRDLFGNLEGCSLDTYSEEGFVSLIDRMIGDKKLLEKNAGEIRRIYSGKMFGFRTYVKKLYELSGDPLPRITAVLPNYNYASYLADRIKSIAAQTFPIEELLLLDDHSTDDSDSVIRTLMEEYRHTFPGGITYIRNEQNSGVFQQWIRGATLAKGDLIWIAEADDSCLPKLQARLVQAFRYDPKVKIAYAQSALMNEKDEIYAENMKAHTYSISPGKWNFEGIFDARTEIETTLAIRNTIPNASATLIRKEAILEIPEEVFSYRVVGDWFAYLHIMQNGRVAFYPESLNLYRRHRNSVVAKNYTTLMKEFYRIHQFLIEKYALSAYTIRAMKKEYLRNCELLKTEQESVSRYDSALEKVPDAKASWCIIEITPETLCALKDYLKDLKSEILFLCISGEQRTIRPEITEDFSGILHLFWMQDFEIPYRHSIFAHALENPETKIFCISEDLRKQLELYR